MTDQNSYTLKSLKEFLNTLTPEQLEQPVNVSLDDDIAQELSGHEIVDEDIYVHKHDECDIGTMEELEEYNPEEFNSEGYMDNYKVTTPKGTIFFF